MPTYDYGKPLQLAFILYDYVLPLGAEARTQFVQSPHSSLDRLRKSHLEAMPAMGEEFIALSYPGNFTKLLPSPHTQHLLILFFATSLRTIYKDFGNRTYSQMVHVLHTRRSSPTSWADPPCTHLVRSSSKKKDARRQLAQQFMSHRDTMQALLRSMAWN
jgi:hypothetical protein